MCRKRKYCQLPLRPFDDKGGIFEDNTQPIGSFQCCPMSQCFQIGLVRGWLAHLPSPCTSLALQSPLAARCEMARGDQSPQQLSLLNSPIQQTLISESSGTIMLIPHNERFKGLTAYRIRVEDDIIRPPQDVGKIRHH